MSCHLFNVNTAAAASVLVAADAARRLSWYSQHRFSTSAHSASCARRR